MDDPRTRVLRARHRAGWLGAMLLLLIISIKLIRWTGRSPGQNLLIGVAPSILGPPGLLLLIRSSSGRISRLTLLQTTLLVGTVALGLELAQLLPRPGILALAKYTFDWADVVASLVSLLLGYVLARRIVPA